ncbi:hypothetical protein BPC006_I1042 [Burkholderia pseudomallei BPC006]|nr:hypothetical protein BPC006_I1042 [Burkholderia pseudomallei BPC006]
MVHEPRFRPHSRTTLALSTPFAAGCSPRCGKIPSIAPTGARRARLRTESQAMPYQSDITQFLNQLKQQKPTLEEEQRKGRALLWDKQPIDLEERDAQQRARVRQTPYVYYQNF